MVTMGDIAKKAGVSTVTVSKALNDKEGVSEDMKRKIKQIAAEMGYRFHAAAKSMRSGRTNNIVILIPERFAGDEQAFYLKFYRQIISVLESYDYYGILQILSADDEERLMLPKAFLENRADGVIALGQPKKEYIEHVIKENVPLVFLDFYMDQLNADVVVTDNFYAVYELTNYLISQGHREIGFVGNVHTTSSIQDRFLGMYKSLLEHRLPFNERNLVSDRDDSGRFIDFVLPEKLPTAFVCNCDHVGYLLIKKLTDSGVRVPEDCSVVGFDNDIYATLSTPPLTTVEVDVEEMAKVATKRMIEKLEGDKGSVGYGRMLIKGSIVFRESVKNIQHD
ncbi:LacI family DNA-binding transcriptional regulator [Shouchella clausii]|jgi:LacI family transcriptional regulator|uniref:Transcriptional regulator n=1 Tax=Shouchella clausii TaxID=79880 RepID=A0A268S5I9_SHOCL|nr:LacI family DNA-binding transcriptional regulator [Shouchella clausii]PAD43438.1 transcriptional regulator [Bacillus sp. 7520-S]SPU18945.1 transcriptional regulator [Niallia circulans]AST95352.1 transcriptional regulator [Shouchella clausii]MBU8595417.1 LacI family DNA-binding transcriptional regulator [Shouchella clausii]MCM3548814.1 LacI family DNA-binding transcriptional regulator [Shouchella clausii]